MRKMALVCATAATLGVTSVAAPAPAEARGGFGPALAGGLLAGAVIGGLASNAWGYGYGPGYGYYGPGYGVGYAPVYYGGYAVPYAAPYYGYGYGWRRPFIRRSFAYYGGPRYYGGWHRRWHHYW